jgi:arylformamidase
MNIQRPTSGVIDLSYSIRPHWRWPVEVERIKAHERGDVFQTSYVRLSMHGYTHVDAPVHFLADGPAHEDTSVEQFIGSARVVDLTHREADEAITADDLDIRGQALREGDIALLRTDWPLRRAIDSREFWGEAPYTAPSACQWLVERGVKAVGYDYPPDEPLKRLASDGTQWEANTADYTTHHIFFPRGVFVIEYLCNLHLLPTDRPFEFIGLPLKMVGTDGAPARVIALIDWSPM